MKHLLVWITCMTFCLSGSAQIQKDTRLPEEEEVKLSEEETKRVDFSVQLKNMHFWRGYAVTKAPLLASNLYYQSPNGLWKFGFWGGMGFDGAYREFDYYVSFQKGNFAAALWDIYNFSTPEISGRGFFDYNNRTTGRFLDLTLAYNFQQVLPLVVSASTILHGRDSKSMETGLFQRSGDLRYTTYVEGRYAIIDKPAYTLRAFVGGAFALSGATETFYTTRSGINFVGFQYTKVVTIGKYEIPVQAMPAWNPDAEHAYMEIAISFF